MHTTWTKKMYSIIFVFPKASFIFLQKEKQIINHIVLFIIQNCLPILKMICLFPRAKTESSQTIILFKMIFRYVIIPAWMVFPMEKRICAKHNGYKPKHFFYFLISYLLITSLN